MTIKEATDLLGGYLMYKDTLVKVVSHNNGQLELMLEIVGGTPCEHCGKCIPDRFSIITDSPLFKENVKPVKTI